MPGRAATGQNPRGPRGPGGQDGPGLAVEALAVAKADARARGDLPAGFGGGSGPGQADDAERPGVSAAASPASPGAAGRRRPRREDPQSLSSAIGGLLDSH